MPPRPLPSILMIALLMLAGCSTHDERLSRLVRDTTAEQASQNRAVTDLNREAVENHRRLVEAVEQSRQDLGLLERDLQQQRDRLDDERRQLAQERYWESLLVPVFGSLGTMLAAALPLVLCWYLLHGLSRSDESTVHETLVRELASQHPLLTPAVSPQRLARDEVPPAPAETQPPF
ncbi:MAG: hypothetical protein AB7F89_10760 [Pirellulaceae bacterium]